MVFRFGVSAVGSLLVDKAVFAVVIAGTSDSMSRSASIALAQLLARVVSGHCNYFCNRIWVFGSRGGTRSYIGYWTLVFVKGALLVAGTSVMAEALDLQGQHITLANITIEIVLFSVSFVIQKLWIFRR